MNTEYINVVFNDTITLPVSRANLTSLEYFNTEYENAIATNAEKVEITVPVDVETRHLTVLFKILGGQMVLPMIDLRSHQDVYTILVLASAVQAPLERIAEGFRGWANNRRWHELWAPEYMYLIYDRMEELVDYKRFFQQHKQPLDHLHKAIELPEMLADAELFIRMLMFYKNYKFETVFPNNNNEVQAKVERLNKQRNDISEVFLVNPHAGFMQPYFNHTVTNYPVWNCAGISVIAAPEPGKPTMAPFEEAVERFHEFTFDMFRKAPNPASGPFPFENVAFAGGSQAKILGFNYNKKNARQSDADIFIFAKSFDERARIFERVVQWFNTPNTYYAIRGSVTTIYIKDTARKFQIISQNASDKYDVIGRFDLTHIQWCFIGNDVGTGQFYGTPEACRAMRERVTRFGNAARVRAPRMIKALHCGYSIYKDDTIMDIYDITDLIANPGENIQLQRMIRDLFKWYYPSTQPDMDGEEERQHILGMIEEDSNATLVANDVQFVLNNVTISGNFENDYESILYKTFNVNILAPRQIGRHGRRVQVMRSKHGIIRLTSGLLTVDNVIINDNGLEIFSKPEDEDFREFTRIAEGNAFRMYAGNGRAVTRHIIDDATGRIRFFIPRYKLDNQIQKGFSVMRSQRGASLNIEEDLRAGDQIQVLFLMEVVVDNNERAVDLKPIKFVKYCKYDPEQAKQLKEVEENLDAEIERVAKEVEFEGEIKYVDPIDEFDATNDNIE